MEDSYVKCRDCKHFGQPDCPTSSKCLAFDDRPYFEPKQKKHKHHTLMGSLLVSFLVTGAFALVFGSDSPLAWIDTAKKVLLIVAILALELFLFCFFYRIEYGSMTKEEKEKRIDRFNKYGW
ncbi:hypothetical protein [Faecalibacterium prausnitzii]|jgi:hypothetical protein